MWGRGPVTRWGQALLREQSVWWVFPGDPLYVSRHWDFSKWQRGSTFMQFLPRTSNYTGPTFWCRHMLATISRKQGCFHRTHRNAEAHGATTISCPPRSSSLVLSGSALTIALWSWLYQHFHYALEETEAQGVFITSCDYAFDFWSERRDARAERRAVVC